ncbi:MAG: riboflavin synthase [Gemmatimonadota bacterium]
MFTGLIEEVGTVQAIHAVEAIQADRALRIEISAARVLENLRIGDSIAVNGVCQTVIVLNDRGFGVEAMAPTLARTTLGELEQGSRVNLERALAFGSRVGGHLVQGHVDGVGTIEKIERVGEHVVLDLAVPEDVAEVTVLHGSIAIDGVSLTVNEIPYEGVVQVALIPHTWAHTSLSGLAAGSSVNLEGDMIGKFVIAYLRKANAI